VNGIAVVVMAYGSPERLEDVPAYYADIRGGRPIEEQRLAELVERYRRLGIEERSPLNAITEQTRAALEQALDVPVFTGMKHWHPRIGDAVERAIDTGAETVVGLVLAPHYSPLSIGGYEQQFEGAVADRANLAFVERWGSDRRFVDLIADRIRGTEAHVVFTAHSLPVEGSGDYREELLETSRLVAEHADVDDWSFSFQSESPTGVPWLEPDIIEHLDTLAREGVRDVLACPIGFVADHLEIRWDLDVEAADRSHALGLEFRRIEMPNAEPAFVEVLAGLVQQAVSLPSRV
jgi:protoporphyrin/coproporphyrin ferrochelatase